MALLSGARLCVLRKKGDGVIREVPIRTNFVKIGSEVHCTIRLKSELTEQLHCKIFVRNEKVMIANYSSKNPITVDGKVINKRGPLNDGSVIEVCGTRFRWQFDESLLPVRTEKSKKVQPTPTSSKFGKSRRTTMALKKAQPIEESETVTESSRKSGPKKSQKSPTYTLPKSNKQLMKNIKKRFTMHSVLVDHQSDDEDDEETDEDESEQNESSVSSPEVVEPLAETPTKLTTPSSSSSPEVVEPLTETPKKLMTPDVSKNNTPFYTPEPEKENQTPVTIGKTPQTPRTPALENSAMMILSYTPVIGPRVKTNLQKTPLSKKKAATPQLRSGYLTPKNDNISVSNTAAKSQSVSKVGNSMYLIDLTSPATANDSSFVYSQSDGSFSSSAGLIDLTTPPSKKLRTPSSTVAKSAQKGLLRSALKNASKTPLSGLRSRLVKETPKSVAKIRLDESIIKTPTTPAKGQNRSRPTTPASTTTSKLRSQTRTPTVDSLSISSKPKTPKTVTNCQDETSKETPVMTTDDLFDTLVGRPSVKKTYTRKSDSPKKHSLPLVAVEGSSELPKTDVDLWVESVVTEATSPPAEPLESFIKKPNRTTQVRSSQYSDITPHESFTDPHNAVPVDPQEATNEKDVSVPLSDDELINMDDKPSIPHAARKSHTPLASKIARSLGNKRQTIGNFFTNMFGKLTVSPVTRVSITDENPSEAVEDLDHDNSEHESDGSEEVYHDSESDHPLEIEKPAEATINPSPKLRQSLRDTRKFIGNALTSLNTSKLTMDNTAEIDESLLLSDTYEENVTNQTEAADEHYDLTDLSAMPDATQSNMSTPAKSTRKTFSRDFRAEISPMVGNDNRFIRHVSTPAGRRSTRQRPEVDISPLAVPIRGTPAKSSPPRKANSTETEQETSMHVNDEPLGSFTPIASGSVQLETVTDIDQNSPMDVTSEDNAVNSTNVSGLESSSADQSIVSPAKDIVSSSPLRTHLSKRISRGSSVNATRHEEQSSAAEESASDVTSTEHSNINQSQLIESIIEPEQQDDSINETEADDSNAHVENTTEDDTEPIVESVATPTESPTTKVQRRRTTTTAPSTPLPEIRSKRSARQSIAVMDGKTSTTSEESCNKTMPMSESKLPLRVHRLTKRSPLSETETVEPPNASPGSNSSITETVTQDVDEEEVSSVQDATNVDKSVLEGETADDSAVESQEQSTSSETASESPIRRGRSSLKQTQTPERLSMTAERQVRRPANGTPLFRKAIFAMCTPTRTSRSSVTRAAPQEETTSRMSRSSRRTTVDEMASVVNEASPIVVAEVDDHAPEQLEASAIISSPAQHTPRTRGSVSNVTTPASTPKTPASVRKSLLTTKAAGSATPTTQAVEQNDLPIDENESDTPTEECVIGEITEGDAVPEQTSPKVSRRLTIARKEITPARQSLAQAEIDVYSESTSQADVEQSSLEQAERDTSLVEQLSESVASPARADQSNKSSPINSTPASARKSLRTSSASILATPEKSIQIANESINTQNFETTATAIDNSSAHEEVLNSNGTTEELAVDQSGYSETPVRASRRSTMNKTRESIAIPTPAKQTPRSRRSSAIQTLTSAKKQTSACDEDSSFVEHHNTSIPKDAFTEDTLNRSVPNVSLDHHTNVNEDVQVRNVTISDAEPDSSLDDNDLQESMANQTPAHADQSNKSSPINSTPASARKSLRTSSASILAPPEQSIQIANESINTQNFETTATAIDNSSAHEEVLNSSGNTEELAVDQSGYGETPVRASRRSTMNKTRESIAIPTPAKQTPRSRRSSAIQTLTSAKKQTSACVEDSSFVEHQNTSIPKDAPTEDTLNRSIPNVSLDHHTNVNEDVQVQNVTISNAGPDSSLDDNDLQESMANQTPIKNTSRTSGRLSKSDTPVSTPASTLPKQLVVIKTPSSVRKSLLKPSQQLELIPEKTVDQDESISTTTDAVTPVKTVDTSRLELTPRSVCPVTPIGLDVVFKTPRPVRGTRTPLATLKKTPATPVPQGNVSGQTVGRRSTRRDSSMGKVNDTNEDCQENQAPVTELFSSPIGDKTTPTKLNSSDANMSPFVVEETPRKTVSPSDDATDECVTEKASSTTSSVELCPDLLKHLCERVITLEHAMENLEDPSQQSMDVTAANSTETLEGIKQLLATPAATSTVRKKLLTSSGLAVLNETVDLGGLGELLKSPAGEAIGSEIRKALRLSTTSTELETIGDEESNMEGVHELMETTANSKLAVAEVSSTNETTDASVNLEGVQHLLKTPAASVSKKPSKSALSTPLNETVSDATANLEGMQQMLATPQTGGASTPVMLRSTRSSTVALDSTMPLEGVRKLLQTPVAARVLANDSSNLEGVHELLKTPAVSASNTSSIVNETVCDTTADLEGMQQMLSTPQAGDASMPVRTRNTRRSTAALDSTLHLEGVRKLLQTPVAARVLHDDTCNLEGVHDLLKTPAVHAFDKSISVNETSCDATADLEGVQQMLATPHASDTLPVRLRSTRSSTASLDSTLALDGIRKLLQTPLAARVLPNDSSNLEGVHELLKTPAVSTSNKSSTTEICDATPDLEGLQQILATPQAGDTSIPVSLRNTRSSTTALDSTMPLEGVRKLLQTPARVLPNDSSNLEGIHDLLKTPALNESTAVNETVCDTTADLNGVQQMQPTPNVSVAAFSVSEMDNTTDLEGVIHLLKTPVASNESHSLEGVQQLMQTPAATKKLTPSSKSTIVKDNKQHMPTTPHDGSMSIKNRSTRSSTSALNSTAHLDGVKHLLKTPVAARVLPNDSYNLEGVQELLQTPATTVRKSMRTSTAIKTLDLAGNSPTITNQTVDTLTASISNELFDTSETELNVSTTAQVEDMTATNAEVVASANEQVDPNSSTSASDSVNLEGIQHLMKTPVTARKSLRNSTLKTSDATVVDSPNLTGVQELMTTPMAKSATKNNAAVPKTPGVANLEGVQQLFKTPVAPVSSRKPLRSSTVVEPIRFDESSILEESQQSASLNDSSKLEAVQQLMKTPAIVGKSLRSTVSTDVNSLVTNSPNLTGVEQLMTTPQSSTSRRVSKVQRIAAASSNTTDRNETVDMEGVQQMLTTPNTTAALNSSDDLDGLQQLLGTPVTETSPNNSCNLEGIQRLMATPAASKKSLRSSVAATDLNLTGLQQLMATPQATSTVKRSTTAPITPSVDTNLDGVQQMFKTPVAPSGSRKNMRSNATTKMNLDESINFEGLQQLLGTPVASTPIVRSARMKHMNDSNLEGVEQLLKTPVANVAAVDQTHTTPTNIASTSTPVGAPSTPIQPASLRKKVELDSPVVKEAASIEVVDQLKTPRETVKTAHKTAQDNSINMSSVQQLFQTPNPPSSVKRRKQNTKAADGKCALDNSVALEDIKELSRTPAASTTTKKLGETPLNDTVNMEGLQQLLETPAEKQTSKQIVHEESVSLEGVEQLLKTPRVTDKTSVVEADKLESKVDSSGVSGAPSDRSSDLFSPPVDEQPSSDTVNVAGIIEMLDCSALTPVEDKSGETPVASTSNSIAQTQVDVPSQTPIPTKLGVSISVAIATEVGTPTTQRLRRKLYTKNDPDDKTPERIKTTVVRPVTSNEYLNIMDPNSIAKDESSEEKRNRLGKKLIKPTEELTDSESESSSDYEDVKEVEPVRKILPSRASRRNIKTLSEEALAGASPELKYVKPKPPKVIEEPTPVTVVTTAEALPTINEDSAINSQDLSAGRRKVMFNENIQIKEINSPAIVGDIIQKVSRGRGGKHQKVVQVIVEQHSIKPARRENKQEQKPDESTPVEVLETDSSKRTRRGVKRVNYAEESMDKPSEATKRTRRGANKADNAEKIVPEADATATKTLEDENSKRSKREADDSSDPATGVETTSSVNVEDTFDKKTHATPSESSLSDENNAVEESSTNSTTMQTSNTASTTGNSEEVKEAEETEEEPKTKRTRRPTTKSKAAPKKPSSRARSKKADSVPEESHDEVAAEPNVSENPTGKEDKSDPIMKDDAEKSSVDTQDLSSDAATPLTKDKVDESDKVDEDSVAKRSRRTVKKKPEPKKSSARAKSKKTDTVQEKEVSHETPSTSEESVQAVPPVDQELSHHAVEDITDKNVEPVTKRSRRAPQKATKDITPSEATDIAVPSSTDDNEKHAETDAEVVSSKRVAKKGSARTAKKNTTELPPDSAEAKAVESEASEATKEVKAKPAPRATAAKGRQRRGVATKVESIDDVASSMEHQTTAASTETSTEVALPTVPVVEAPIVEQAVADSTSQDEPQPAPVKRGRNARKPAAKTKVLSVEASKNDHEQSEVSTMPPPAMIITPEPTAAASKKPARRGRQKAVVEEQHPELHHTIEESLNESHMVKTMLPSSHTSTPLMRIEEEKPKPTRGGRSRKLNPVVAALIEDDANTPSRRSPRSLRAGSESRTEDSQSVASTSNTKQSRARATSKMSSVDDSHEQSEKKVATITEEETTEDNETADALPTGKSRARRNPPTKRTRGKAAEQPESEELEEVVPKRNRKAPAKYRDAQPDSGTKSEDTEEANVEPAKAPARSRRGAKSTKPVPEPTVTTTDATETNDESEAVAQAKPSRSRKVATKRPAATRKKVDVDTEDDEASVVKQAREDEEPVEATSSRRRPLRTRK